MVCIFFYAPALIDQGYIVFGPSVCTFVHKNFYIGDIFWLVRVKTFIFNMSIPCDKTFLLVTSSKSSARSRSGFKVIFIKKTQNFDIGHTFWLVRVRTFIFHMSIPFYKTFLLVLSWRSSVKAKVRPCAYKAFFMLDSAEHEISMLNNSNLINLQE